MFFNVLERRKEGGKEGREGKARKEGEREGEREGNYCDLNIAELSRLQSWIRRVFTDTSRDCPMRRGMSEISKVDAREKGRDGKVEEGWEEGEREEGRKERRNERRNEGRKEQTNKQTNKQRIELYPQ